MKNCKHVVPILGAFCLMASLSFMPKEAWAESSLAPISQQQGSYQLTGTILDGMGEPVIGTYTKAGNGTRISEKCDRTVG